MNYVCQESALLELSNCRNMDRHSVLISGPEGCGKSYLAYKYADMLEIDDIQTVDCTVASIRSAINDCYAMNNRVVVVVENLDQGVAAASYTLLKFLEEPTDNIYVIVTCRNILNIPDTIVSRSIVIDVSPPTDLDISNYALQVDPATFNNYRTSHLWRCVKSFSTAKYILSLDREKFLYLSDLRDNIFKDTVSNIVWKLGHFQDNSETDLRIVINHIMITSSSPRIFSFGMSCLHDLECGRIAKHAVLAKFVLDCKYSS